VIKKVASPTAGWLYVSFELPSCLWADRIFLVGDFNQWDESSMPMRQDRDGIWRVTVELPLGHCYEFRYLIDGTWMSDSHADGFAQNSFGISNSIVQTTMPVTAMESIDSQIHEIPKAKNWSHRVVVAPQSTHHQSAFGHRTRIPAIAQANHERVTA